MYPAVTLAYMDAQTGLDVYALGRRLLDRRQQLGLEQEDVATKAGMSRAYISRLERGVVPNPKWLDLAQVADALGVSVADLTAPHAEESSTDNLRREAQAVLGFDDGVLLEAIVRKVRDRPALDRKIVLRVVADLVSSFPPITPDRPD